MEKSPNSHPDTTLGSFTSRTIVKGMMLQNYLAFAVYVNLTKERYKTKTYREGVMQVTAQTFWKLVNNLPEKVMKKDGIRHKALVVPAPFFALQYISDACFLPGTVLWKL